MRESTDRKKELKDVGLEAYRSRWRGRGGDRQRMGEGEERWTRVRENGRGRTAEAAGFWK